MRFFYVYTLRSESYTDEIYTGFTGDLRRRLEDHNSGKVSHTAKFRPWNIRSATAFDCERKARAFEKYLKSSLRWPKGQLRLAGRPSGGCPP